MMSKKRRDEFARTVAICDQFRAQGLKWLKGEIEGPDGGAGAVDLWEHLNRVVCQEQTKGEPVVVNLIYRLAIVGFSELFQEWVARNEEENEERTDRGG
jgi:hypothetical protein